MASSSKQQLFFQSVKVNGKEIPIFNLDSGVYIEGINLEGPQLIFNFYDVDNSLRDDYGLVDGAVLSVKMGDVSGRGDAYFTGDFVVGHPIVDGDFLRVEALEKQVYAIKKKLTTPMFFNGERIAEILATLFTGYTVEVANATSMKQRLYHHVATGSTPAAMLRLVCRDLGCAIWVARGKVYCAPLNMLGNQEKNYPILEYQAKKSEHPIFAYQAIHVAEAAARQTQKCYMSWDMVNGMQKSTAHPDAPRQILPQVPLESLNNLHIHVVPRMLADMLGNGTYTAGMTVGVRLNRFSRGAVLDESMPARQLITLVSHIEDKKSYKCKVTTGVIQA